MVVPAIYITYLLSNAVSIKKRIIHLIVGTAVLLAVSFSWALVVDLVPAANRPYVGSSTNNSEMELIIGHNGLEDLVLEVHQNAGNPGGNKGKVVQDNQELGVDATSSAMKGQGDKECQEVRLMVMVQERNARRSAS